jgi:hypothetical protein
MWQLVAGFLTGTALGIALPWILFGLWTITSGVRLPLRVKAFLSFLTAYSSALGGGALIALVSGRFELFIAGASVLAGLAIDAIVYRDETEQVPGKRIRAYALGFGPSFVIVATAGALIPAI